MRLIILFLFFTANLLGQVPPPLTGSGSTVRTNMSTSRSAPERFEIVVTDTLCDGALSRTEVFGLPSSLFEVQFQYGWYDSNGGWNIHSYETITYNYDLGGYIHNYRFTDEFGELLEDFDFAVWAHAWDLATGRNYYGYSENCSHGWQGTCTEPIVTIQDFCDTLFVRDTIFLPELVEAPEILINCPQYLSVVPSHFWQGQTVYINFENPFNEIQRFQIFNTTTGKVHRTIESSGIRVALNTSDMQVGGYIVYLVTPGFQNCGVYYQISVCERP